MKPVVGRNGVSTWLKHDTEIADYCYFASES
jgi:hypothetical protein